jgi:hypothetical protein
MNCTFDSNRADGSSAAAGGGMASARYHSPTMINCTFSHNVAEGPNSKGGAIFGNFREITNCTLTGNIANFGGGGIAPILTSDRTPQIKNTIIAGNIAGNYPDIFYPNPTCDLSITKIIYCFYKINPEIFWS